jgi:hypothetical protein
MNYEPVFNIFLGMLALLGCVLVIIFWIVSEKKIRSPQSTDLLRALRTPIAMMPTQQSPTTLDPKQARRERRACCAC